jgi:hypothetical protein
MAALLQCNIAGFMLQRNIKDHNFPARVKRAPRFAHIGSALGKFTMRNLKIELFLTGEGLNNTHSIVMDFME